MLLVQASKDISQPGQMHKMGFLEKIVNGLKFILRLNWSQPLKNFLFRTFQPLGSWPTGSGVITGFLQLLGSLGSLVFNLFLVSISFAYTS